MNQQRYVIGCGIFSLLSLTGCATPSSVKDSAIQGISLISELNSQLNSFNEAEARSEKYLLKNTTLAKKEAAQDLRLLAPDSVAAKAAARTASLEISNRLKTLTVELATADQAYSAATQQIDVDMLKLLTALPSTSKSLTATQSALSPLTKDLSPETQAKEAYALIKVIRQAVKDSEDMMKKAEVAASSPK